MDLCFSRYRYQLEAFVDKVRGRSPADWYEPAKSISELETIERVYLKVNYGSFQPRMSLNGEVDRVAIEECLVIQMVGRNRDLCLKLEIGTACEWWRG